ncbi:MAG: ABC transporter substrate-binding protein [Vibrio sp.]
MRVSYSFWCCLPLYIAARAVWLTKTSGGTVILLCTGLMSFSLFANPVPTSIEHDSVRVARHQPMRVVTLFQGATDSAVALGIQPVGVVDSWSDAKTYRYLRSALKGVPHVGLETQPNLEAIAALHPDLIIGTKVRHAKIYAQLSHIAKTVYTDNVYDFQQTLTRIAKATGREAKAQQLLHHWRARVANVRNALQRSQPHWPLSASIIDVRPDHLRLYLDKSFPGSVLSEIGFTLPNIPSAAGWGVKLKSKESLPTVNADVFFVILHADTPAVLQNYQQWRQHPLWKMLNAPKHGQVTRVNRIDWLFSGGILGANRLLDELSTFYHVQPAKQQM